MSPSSAGWKEAFRDGEGQDAVLCWGKKLQHHCPAGEQRKDVRWEYNHVSHGANQRLLLGFFFNGLFRGKKKTQTPHPNGLGLSAQLASLKKSEFLGCFGKPLLFVRVLVQISGCYEKQRNVEFCKLLPRDVCVFDQLILAISSCWLRLTPCTLPFVMSFWLVGGLSPATVPIPSIHPGAPGLIWRVAMTSMPGAVEAAYPHHPLDPGLRRSRASSHPPRHISWGWQRSGTTWRVSYWVKSQLCLH